MKDGGFVVWPAIDLVNGQCVRLERGEFRRPTVYSTDPVAVAAEWVRLGARGLHIVDLDGARSGASVHLELAARIAAHVGVPVQFGGGLRRLGDVVRTAQAGLRPIVGTRAITDPAFLGHALSLARDLVLAIDVRDGRVATHGWRELSGESIGECLASARDLGVQTVLVTDVTRDGTLSGPNLELPAAVAGGGIEVIAAGGIRSLDDVSALAEIDGVGGCVIGKALYEGTIDPSEAFGVGWTVAASGGRNRDDLAGRLRFGADGLIPVVVQESGSGVVLMVAYASREAVMLTQSTGDAHFYSRSRGRLWRKGETSHNTMRVIDLRPDCDGDALLMTVVVAGPACHTGARSCFGDAKTTTAGTSILDEVWAVLADRKRRPASGSYSSGLLAGGAPPVARKLGEEAIEAIVALLNETDDRLIAEIADLWFFSLVALCLRGVAPAAVYQELAARRKPVQGGNCDQNSN